ncbi:histidinol-phosphate aminotransferase family protein [Candidatus Parcubacteria bacterium]|nr:histidinol-phosphate aminotransferase family protein [Candidatus Parcubacteria bacterium]
MALNFNKNIFKAKKWTPPIGREHYIKLDLNENYGLFDKNFLNKFLKIDNFVVSSYPEYNKLLKLLSKYTGQPVENIALANGGDQAIELLLRLFFNKNSVVVMPSPVFSIYDHILETLDVKVKHIAYIDGSDYFKFPIDETLKHLKNSSGLILCNPNNPLGSFIEKHDLLKLILETNKLNIPCIIDEAYFEFYGQTSAPLIKKYKNLIIIRTFSKMFGLAGLRLGYILANETIIEQLLKIRGPWDVNHFAVFAGEIALKNIGYFFKKLKTFLSIKKELENFLIKQCIKVYKTNTNFLVVKPENKEELLKKLNKNKILVNDVSAYPFNFNLLDNSIRITVPSNKKDLKILKNIIK